MLLLRSSPSIASDADFNNGNSAYKSKSYKKAARFYNDAIKDGDGGAACNLGVLTQKGEGVKPDLAKARKLFKMAADQGLACGEFNLALSYIQPDVDAKNRDRHMGYFLKAANQNVKAAANNYAVDQLLRRSTQLDIELVEKLLLQASSGSDKNIWRNLGIFYLEVKGDEKNGEKWLSKAVKAGDEVAKRQLAFHVYKKQDFKTAHRLFSELADVNDVYAKVALGGMYANGEGCDKNDQTAVELFFGAANAGSLEAMVRLAYMNQVGRGGAVNLKAGNGWLTRARSIDVEETNAMIKKLEAE